MSARARQTISSGYGTFLKGDAIRGVPDAVVEAWAGAGIATIDPPAEPVPEPAAEPEPKTAPATASPARAPRRSQPTTRRKATKAGA